MDISFLGHSSFKIKTKTATIVCDPYLTKSEADIVTISHSHFDHNVVDKISGYKKIIEGPGEYEVSGVSITGYKTFHDDKKGSERGTNTVYVIEAEGLKLAHLGDIGHKLDEDLISEMGDIDILLIPVGGFYTIGPKEAVTEVGSIEPYFVIPMHYKESGAGAELSEKLESVESFIKESGLVVERIPKFSIRKEDILEDQSTKIIILERK